MADKKEIMLIKGLTFCYGDSLILDNIDLTIWENDFIGIIGPNGGGKTTLLKIMLGLLKPGSGEIKILGDLPERARKHIGYVPQYSRFDEFFPINVRDVVLLGLMGNKRPGSAFSREEKSVALSCLDKVGLADMASRHICKLSYGQRQRVFIARAMVNDPSLLLLDEPTASVDSTSQDSFYGLLSELKRKMAIVLVTHDMGAVSTYVEKIGCLNKKFYYHGSGEIKEEDLSKAYGCPMDLIAHGIPHRVMKEHK